MMHPVSQEMEHEEYRPIGKPLVNVEQEAMHEIF